MRRIYFFISKYLKIEANIGAKMFIVMWKQKIWILNFNFWALAGSEKNKLEMYPDKIKKIRLIIIPLIIVNISIFLKHFTTICLFFNARNWTTIVLKKHEIPIPV